MPLPVKQWSIPGTEVAVTPNQVTMALSTFAGCGLALFCARRVHVCGPSHVFVKTGPFIRGQIHVSRRTIRWPFQRVKAVSLQPDTHTVRHPMRVKGRVQVQLELAITTGPFDPFDAKTMELTPVPPPLPIGVELPQDQAPSTDKGVFDKDKEEEKKVNATNTTTGPEKEKQDVEKQDKRGWWQKQMWFRPKSYGYFDNYATRISLAENAAGDSQSQRVKELLLNAVDGGARALVAGLSHEEIFAQPDFFKQRVQFRIQHDLQPFGIKILAFNVKDFMDMPDSPYLDSQSRKLLAQVGQESELHVQQNTMLQKIGTQERQANTRKSVATADADAELIENREKQRKAESHMIFATASAQFDQKEKIAKIEAELNAERKRIELETLNAELTRAQEEAKLRATELATATVQAESKIKAAQGQAQQTIEVATGEANAMKIRAEALLYQALKEAEGTQAKLEAEAAGLQKIFEATTAAPEYAKLMRVLSSNQPQEIAQASADALQNLSPKISYFVNQHQNGANGSASLTDPLVSQLRQFGFGMLPLLKSWEDATGVRIPGVSPPSSSKSE